jgi:tetratricopeptide (TPR) repeat protein
MLMKKSKIYTLNIILLTLTISMLSVSCDKPDRAQQRNRQGSAVTGPIIDMNIQGGGVMNKLDLDGKSPESLALLGDQYFESGSYIQAIDVYTKVIELNPKDADTYNDLGLALHYTGQSIEAIDILKKGTEADPNYQNVWLSLGYVLTSTTRNAEAKIALQKAVMINPNTAQGQEANRMLQTIN